MKNQIKDISDKFWLPLLLASVAAVGMLVGYRLDEEYIDHEPSFVDSPEEVFKPGRIEELIKYVDAKYVDEVDSDELMEETMGFILNQLDPFSSYLTPNELKRYEEQISGRFDGLGLELRFVRDTLSIFYVYPGSPAEKVGLKVGDRIWTIDDQSVSGHGLSDRDIDLLIKNTDEAKVKFRIHDDVTGTQRTLDLVRGSFVINSVSCAYMLNDSIGYIHLTRFTKTSYRDFMEAMGQMCENEGMKHLVFDLRNNLGGVLREAIKILQEFYAYKDQLLLFTQGDNNPREEYVTHGKPFHRVDRIAVLINNSSASASEVIAGAFQDTDRAMILGENSYGKGLVQEHYKLRNGGELRLTIARYYTPSGRLIQRPYRSANDLTDHRDTSDFKTNLGRTVLAGGGIVPDQLIPDSPVSYEILDSMAMGKSYEIILDYLLQSQRQNRWSSIDEVMDNNMQITNDLYRSFLGDDKAKLKELEVNEDVIKRHLFSSFVHVMGGDQHAEQVTSIDDALVQAGLDYFSSAAPISISLE